MGDPLVYLLKLSEALLDAYRTADTKHHVQINQLHLLPGSAAEHHQSMERKLVESLRPVSLLACRSSCVITRC